MMHCDCARSTRSTPQIAAAVAAEMAHRDGRKYLFGATSWPSRPRPVHSITSSARKRIVVGTSRLSALAALRLITSSNVVDCITGSSVGLAPLRTRPVYTPSWRFASVMLVP